MHYPDTHPLRTRIEADRSGDSLHPRLHYNFIIWVCESPAIILYGGRFDGVEINYLNLSLTGILKLNFIAYFLPREKFETTPSSLSKTTEKLIRLNFYINQYK